MMYLVGMEDSLGCWYIVYFICRIIEVWRGIGDITCFKLNVYEQFVFRYASRKSKTLWNWRLNMLFYTWSVFFVGLPYTMSKSLVPGRRGADSRGRRRGRFSRADRRGLCQGSGTPEGMTDTVLRPPVWLAGQSAEAGGGSQRRRVALLLHRGRSRGGSSRPPAKCGGSLATCAPI
jgi:hypothetical protein